jgi:hypothetical protein
MGQNNVCSPVVTEPVPVGASSDRRSKGFQNAMSNLPIPELKIESRCLLPNRLRLFPTWMPYLLAVALIVPMLGVR